MSALHGEDERYILIYGGPVYTMDARDRRAEAVLIKDDRVAAVGSRGLRRCEGA